MKILVNGGSLSRGPGSWPYVIQQELSAEMVNLSQAGAGTTYVHESTLAELCRRKYDLVLLQWPPAIRLDYKVQDIEQFNQTIFTSKHQSQQNDWPEKVVYPINDQDYVEKDWIFGCGYILNHDQSLKSLFDPLYTHTSHNEHMYHMLIKLISMQSYLKLQNIPYLFSFTRPLKLLPRFEHLNQQLDQSHMFQEVYLSDIANQYNWWDNEGLHPNEQAYAHYAQAILPAQ